MSARDLHVTRALLPCEFKSSGRRKLVKSAGGHPCDQKVSFWPGRLMPLNPERLPP
jgi:hypothetical protein